MSDDMGATTELLHPYVTGRDPGHYETAAEHMDRIGASPRERRLIEQGVAASWEFERAMGERLLAGGRVQRRSSAPYTGPTADGVMEDSGLPFRRRMALLHVVVRLGREQGLSFSYVTSSRWRQKLEAEDAA